MDLPNNRDRILI